MHSLNPQDFLIPSYLVNLLCRGHSFLCPSVHLPLPRSCQELQLVCPAFSPTLTKLSLSLFLNLLSTKLGGPKFPSYSAMFLPLILLLRNKPATKVPNQGPHGRVEPAASQYEEAVHPLCLLAPLGTLAVCAIHTQEQLLRAATSWSACSSR